MADQTAEEIEEKLAELDELEITAPEDRYWFAANDDEKLKCFLIDGFVSADYEGRVMVQSLDMLYQWIKTGKVPNEKPVEAIKSRLRAVQTTPPKE